MKVRDVTQEIYNVRHGIYWVLEDDYSKDIEVYFTSYEIIHALETDDRFEWLPEYYEMEEREFVNKFEDDFMNLNSEWIEERAWERTWRKPL